MTNKKMKIIDARVEDIISDKLEKKSEGTGTEASRLEARLKQAFSNDAIKVLLITDRLYDPITFEVSQGIKLDVNGAIVKMKWNIEVANAHQQASKTPQEDIIYNAVVGTLTAWGTCRMTVID